MVGARIIVMKKLLLLIVLVFFLTPSLVSADKKFQFSGKIKCELSATFIVFDFDKKIAIRNNYDSSKFKLLNYETKKNKFRRAIHTFSWYDMKNNFLGYWIMSDDAKNIEEIKFDGDGKIYSINRNCSIFNNNKIGELIWE